MHKLNQLKKKVKLESLHKLIYKFMHNLREKIYIIFLFSSIF